MFLVRLQDRADSRLEVGAATFVNVSEVLAATPEWLAQKEVYREIEQPDGKNGLRGYQRYDASPGQRVLGGR
jgi:hypothetical protein